MNSSELRIFLAQKNDVELWVRVRGLAFNFDKVLSKSIKERLEKSGFLTDNRGAQDKLRTSKILKIGLCVKKLYSLNIEISNCVNIETEKTR